MIVVPAATRQVVLRRRPGGVPVPEDFGLAEAPVPQLRAGEVLLRTRIIAVAPGLRARLDEHDTYLPAIPLGGPLESPTIGEVVASESPDHAVGDVLFAMTPWAEHVVVGPGTALLDRVAAEPGVPLSHYAGVLGGTGCTAYVGLHDIGRVQAGDVVVVSAAAGAVGSVAGQIARLRGARRVVGVVGTAEKAAIAVDRLGFDAAVVHRDVPDLAAAVLEACPDGVDLYFDNVGGPVLDALLRCMRPQGRVVACGMMDAYNRQADPPAIHSLWEAVARQLRVQGFLLMSHAASIPGALADLHQWVRDGELVALEHQTSGIERAAAAFCDLMAGRTTGKTLVVLDGTAALAG